MAWNAITFDEFVVISHKPTAQWYVANILPLIVSPFLLREPELTFQHDKFWLQTVCVSMNFLQAFSILPWPASSSDLSSIEHIWDVYAFFCLLKK